MLISWMGYAMAVSLCEAVIGLVFDRLAGIWGMPRRWAWVVALIVSVATPPLLAFRPAPAARVAEQAAHASPVLAIDRLAKNSFLDSERVRAIAASIAQLPWTTIAIAVWAIGTLVCLTLLLRDVVRVRRRRSIWQSTYVDGVPVYLSDDDGPAVIGLRRPAIVLPAWSLQLGDYQRSLMLRHEQEHMIAGDYRLAFAASVAVTLMPWCVGMWWIARRLRLAIEIDCDARVLRVTAHPREYGLLLIAVGARQSLSLPFAVSLAELRPLEERILAMTAPRPARPTMASVPFVALGIIAVAVAAQAPVPAPLANVMHAGTPAVSLVAQRPAALPAATPSATPASSPFADVVHTVYNRPSVAAEPTEVSPLHLAAVSHGKERRYRVMTQVAGVDFPTRAIGRTQKITGSVVVDSSGAVVSDSFPTAEFVPLSVTGLATKPGVESAPFSMVGQLTVHGVTRPVTWVGSARSAGDTVRGAATTAFTFEDFGLVGPRKATSQNAKDSITLEYNFDIVTAPGTFKH
ncbi:MAG TPA: M56 family metallopeptidase [Gemmatimonadaceae bacterium]|jgi:beta-lactamase regulating signal transducer with metallopeptidase domain